MNPATNALVVEVRMPEELITGLVRESALIQVIDALFDAKIAEFDSNADCVVCGGSGNQSAKGFARMREAGIGNIVDLGSLENALAVVSRAIVTR